MTWLGLLILAAALAFALSQWGRLPVVPLLVLFGFFVGNSGIPLESSALHTSLDLGLAFLVFTAGMELNPDRFSRLMRAVLWVGGIQFFCVGVAGLSLALVLGYRGGGAIFLALALATSSTLVVVRRLQETPGSMASYGRLVVGVVLVQDVLMIFLMVTLGKLPGGWLALGQGWLSLGALIGAALGLQRWLAPWVIRRVKMDDETWLMVTLALLFLFVGGAFELGIPPVAGAFLAGFALSGFPIGGLVKGLLGSLTTFFLAVFFTALGATVGVPSWAVLWHALACVALVLVATPVLVTVVAEWKGGLTSRKAISSGLLLAQTSEFALVLGLFGLQEAGLPQEIFSIIALVAVLTMTMTPFLATDGMARRLLHWHPLRRRLKPVSDLRDHTLVLGYGSSGPWILKPWLAAGHSVVVVDHDAAVIAALQDKDIRCVYGDAADEKVLGAAGARHARLVLVSMSELPDALNVLHYVKGVPVVVRVFEEAHARAIEAAGGVAVLNSLAAADVFMEWFEDSAPDPQRKAM